MLTLKLGFLLRQSFVQTLSNICARVNADDKHLEPEYPVEVRESIRGQKLEYILFITVYL